MSYTKEEYEEKAYNSAYNDQIADLVGKVASGEKFDYNPLTDASYQAYAKQYNRLGQEASENVLNDVAINTGGLANSYAVSAASQAQNRYNQELADKVPELEALAYQKYMGDKNYNLNALGALQALEDSSYSKWADSRDYDRGVYESDRNFGYNQYIDDRNFGYQQNRDKVADKQWQDSFDYQKGRDEVADKQWQDSFDYQHDRDKIADSQWQKEFDENKHNTDWEQRFAKHQDEYQRMYNKWTTMGYANKQVAKYFGIKQGTKTSDQAYRDAQMAMAQTRANRPTGRPSGGRTTTKKTATPKNNNPAPHKTIEYNKLSGHAKSLENQIASSAMQHNTDWKKGGKKSPQQIWAAKLVNEYNAGKITYAEYQSLKAGL